MTAAVAVTEIHPHEPHEHAGHAAASHAAAHTAFAVVISLIMLSIGGLALFGFSMAASLYGFSTEAAEETFYGLVLLAVAVPPVILTGSLIAARSRA